jgi:small subunit ribosomal protein S16
LRRIGKKKQPQYRLIVAEAASPRDGRFIESIGRYNPRLDPPLINVDEERALAWLRQGAQPSDTAKSMLVKTGVWEKFSGEPAPTPPPPPAPQAVAEVSTESPEVPDQEPTPEAEEDVSTTSPEGEDTAASDETAA